MDEITKRAIKKTILALRNLLEKEDIPAVLKQHGIFPDGRRVHPEKISLLDDAGKSRRERLEAILERETKSAGNDPEAGVRRYCREVAFTYLNRLIALRCMEMRALIDECIKTRGDYAERSLRHHRFRREYPEVHFDAEDVDGLKAFLYSVFGELQNDIKILFDPDDEYSIIMPSLKTLRECIRALNEDITEDAFKEPELIGWVYQYFQTEEKNRVFEEVRTKKKKIEGDDIVPATSLYTERYMVDYLVQNSLGAIWMEMYPDSKLCEKWPYFVKDQDRKPREPRPIKSLTFLDPACGSGHFLLVALDLLIQMYQEEARLAEEAKVRKEWVVPKEKIATTIIESNLHGIDIDLRSVQLSWLVLYLKMREHQNSVDAAKSLPKKVNLVAADASLLDAPDFLSWCEEKFKGEPYVLNIIKGVAKRLYGLSEIGSLARPEEDLKELIKKEKERLLSVWKREKQPGQMLLFQEFLTPEQQELPFEKVTDVQFWEGLTRRFLRILDVFLKRTREEMRERLFATDLQRVIVFLDLCRKRYDVVATNPPYMGSNNMGKHLKDYVQRVYPEGKRDLYTAFIQRNCEFSSGDGRVAMVTRKPWLFMKSFSALREVLFPDVTVETVIDLGSRAFDPENKLHDGVDVDLFVLQNKSPFTDHSVFVVRLTESSGPVAKSKGLLESLQNKLGTSHFTPNQMRLSALPGSPLIYWLSPDILNILNWQTRLAQYADTCQGLRTTENNRFVRYFWEVQSRGNRWFNYSKGGRYQKWYGLNRYLVDFRNDGELIKKSVVAKYPYLNGKWEWVIGSQERYFERGLCYSCSFSGSLGVRILDERSIFDPKGPAIFPLNSSNFDTLLHLLNSRVVTFLLRATSPGLDFNPGYVSRLPFPQLLPGRPEIASFCTRAKQALVCEDMTEASYRPITNPSLSKPGKVLELWQRSINEGTKICSLLHGVEGYNEKIALSAFRLQESQTIELTRELGTPAGWYALIQGYDAIPEVDMGEVPKQAIEYVQNLERICLSKREFARIKSRLRALYEAGPGAKAEDVLEKDSEKSEDNKEGEILGGKRISIPTETFLEELSVKIEIHPISVYWLLNEMREKEGIVCWPECKRYVEDYFTVMILRMLGLRWPKQIETNEPIPKWADKDGIIPITGHTGEKTLFERIRDHIGSEFGEDRIDAIEQEFSDILYNAACKEAEIKSKKAPKKITLADWLEREFFKRHTSQFKKRPIAWHLSSTNGTFQVLLFYHRLSGDILRNLKNRYLARVQSYYGVLLERARSGQSVSGGLTPGKLQDIEAELEDFAAKLDKVINLPYEPLIDDGVRVNIASLQKMGLLKHPVLAAKDVDRAIADRNRWREDDKEQNTVWNLKELKT